MLGLQEGIIFMNVGKCYENTQLSTALKPLEASKEIYRASPRFFRGWGLCYVRGLKLSIAQTRVV